jgi:hypothetical protein
MHASRRLAVTGVLLLAATCANAQLYIPPQELKEKLPIVGILPTPVLLPGEEGKAAAAQIDAQLASGLRAAGFEVVDSDVFRAIEDENRRISGGWFDPITGRVNEETRGAVFSRSVDTFRERNKLLGFAWARVERRMVEFKDPRRVAWDGVQEDVVVKEGALAALGRAFGSTDQGRVSALSLKLQVFNPRAQPVYDAMGGIGTAVAVVNKQFVEVDRVAVLADTARIERAVQIVLWPLTHNGANAPVQQLAKSGDKRASTAKVPLAVAATPVPSLSRAEIRQKVMVIALTPIEDPGHPKIDLVRTQYEAQLTSALEAGGFKVTPSDLYAKAYDTAIQEVHGIYDPFNGERIAANVERVQQIVYAKLHEERGVDAILAPAFESARAEYDGNGQATWDGTSESIFATVARWNGMAKTGVTPAISLTVKLTDSSGKQIYAGRGGVDLAALYINGGFEPRPQEQLLLDSTKQIQAVRIALSKLVESP